MTKVISPLALKDMNTTPIKNKENVLQEGKSNVYQLFDSIEIKKLEYLLKNDLLVLGKLINNDKNNINLEVILTEEEDYIVLAFTSPEMLKGYEFKKDGPDLLILNGRELLTSFKEYNFVINPFSEFPIEILKEDIETILTI